MPRGRRDEDDITRPTKATVSGRAFLALQREAKTAGRTTAEYLRLYALEGFLLRLAYSPYKNRFVLKGGPLIVRWLSGPPFFHWPGAAAGTTDRSAEKIFNYPERAVVLRPGPS
jgi:hypothetical protein